MIDRERIKQRARLIRPLFVPLVLYIGLLTVTVFLAPSLEAPLWRYIVALLPMIPGLFIAVGLVRVIGKLDELERQILLEAAAFGFIFTLILLLSFVLLEIAGVAQPSTASIMITMTILLMIGKFWGNWRHR